MLRELEQALNGITSGWYEKLLADARELSGYEINWNVKPCRPTLTLIS